MIERERERESACERSYTVTSHVVALQQRQFHWLCVTGGEIKRMREERERERERERKKRNCSRFSTYFVLLLLFSSTVLLRRSS